MSYALVGQAFVLGAVAAGVLPTTPGVLLSAACSVALAWRLLARGTRATDGLRDIRTRVLHQIAAGEPLAQTLETTTSFIASLPHDACCVLVAERTEHGTALRPLTVVNVAPDVAATLADECARAALLANAPVSMVLPAGNAFRRVLAAAVNDSVGATIGVIALLRADRTAFGRVEHEMLANAADVISVAMARTRSDAATQSLVEDLESRNLELDRLRSDAEEAKAKAEAAAHAKSEFLANMSHELRTPMTAILGFADVLQQGSLSDEERREHVMTIRRAGEHLLALINDVLDLSKIEAGKLHVESVSVSPLQIMRDAVSLFREKAASKGVSLVTRCDGAIPLRMTSDPTRLRQILINLIGNAVKFTDRGEVVVRLAMKTRPDVENPQLYLEVTDTGIGIKPDVVSSLFTAFTQADSSMTRKYGGTGLGLAICKRLSELLGGSIEVESQPGRGSTFRVAVATGDLTGVPMVAGLDALNARPSIAPAESDRLTGRVLVADDGLDNQRLLAFHLRRAGADVEVVSNGRDAVRRALESLNEPRGPFALILMDMQMPELDGYQAATALRARRWTGPIVALTAHGAEDERSRCIAAGCDEYEPKPINRDTLLRICRQLMNRPIERRRSAA